MNEERNAQEERSPVSPIDHVVVLMLENRSFDHMLGFLFPGDPSNGGVREEDKDFSNLIDPTDPDSERVFVTKDADPHLVIDPPHSYANVVAQMGMSAVGPPRMDGFIAAYARKIAGTDSGEPVIHWARIGAVGAAAATVAVLATTVPLPVATATSGALLAGIWSLVDLARRRRAILTVDHWTPFYLWPLGAVAVAAGVSSGLGRVGWPWWARAATVGGVLAATGGRELSRRRKDYRSPPKVDPVLARRIMRCLALEKVPALAELARSFAVCTRWHCSVPGATWPNRNFAHAGTSDGTVDIEPDLYGNDTIFQRLEEVGHDWRIYRDPDSMAQVMVFDKLSDNDSIRNWYPIAEFFRHARNGDLPAYTFIEPAHEGPLSNSQHPGNNDYNRIPAGEDPWDFERGDALIAQVYEALKVKPEVFARAVLVITYDEHGGFYDHRPPPTDAIAPDPLGSTKRRRLHKIVDWFVEQEGAAFPFTTLGPRVPTVIVSPRVANRPDDTLYDHTSIPRTIRKLFGSTSPLSLREATANTFDGLLTVDPPRTDLPDLREYEQPRLSQAAPEWGSHGPSERNELLEQLDRIDPKLRAKLEHRFPVAHDRGLGDPGQPPNTASLFTVVAEAERSAGRRDD